MVPGVVCWETFASGPCSPGGGHLCRRVKEQEVVVVGGLQRSAQSQRVPSPFFLKLLWIGEGRKAVVLQHMRSFWQWMNSWAMVTGQVLTCKGGQQASHHDVQAELPKRFSVLLGELPPKLWQMEGEDRSPDCCWLLSHVLSPCPEAGGEMFVFWRCLRLLEIL